MDSLPQIDLEVSVCRACPLSQNRTTPVSGEGSGLASVMFIGEAPGYNEDRLGRPFVGAAGQVLDSLLTSVGLSRENVFITNTVKCRPANNRDPLPNEITACRDFLDRQIGLIAPKVIVTLGRHALASFLPGETIGKAHGKSRDINGTILFPMYHPAAALHQGGLRAVIQEDMRKLVPLIIEESGNEHEENWEQMRLL
ncbi:uncharacterized protein METZ01_LOCUS367605 [marine metagenome]|uniref:Type-4 uracil-DNA glycosylase n=1 Tax=marine metagenome TaxID=408172 RepID=A0A382T0J4_9ZZZZ